MHINPKVVAFFIVLIAVTALVFWTTREYSETNPPAPDSAAAEK